MVDFDKINRLRKLRDEIEELIDEELSGHPYEIIRYPETTAPVIYIYSPPFPPVKPQTDWKITCTC